jgi:hypothetical protein
MSQAAETSANSDAPENTTEFVDHLVDETSGKRVSIGELLDTVSHRSYGPLLLLPALIAASPIGSIPGMSIATGTIIVLVAGQMLLGFNHPWVPGKLRDFEFDRDRLTHLRDKAKDWLRWLDRPLSKRWTQLTEPPWVQVVAVVCIALALTFFPLALVPFGVFVPSVAICVLALGLMARDGFVVAGGLVAAVGIVIGAVWLWPG